MIKLYSFPLVLWLDAVLSFFQQFYFDGLYKWSPFPGCGYATLLKWDPDPCAFLQTEAAFQRCS